MKSNCFLIKKNFDELYTEYNFMERLCHDPIVFLHKFAKPEDIEIVGFIASSFAYGKIDFFKGVIERILKVMGQSPYDFLMNFDINRHRSLFSGISYRFSDNDDIINFLFTLHKVLKKYERLESLFNPGFSNTDENIGRALTGFVNTFLNIGHQTTTRRSNGFLHFFPSPEKRSACKRLNLFLRWMVRDKDIDVGIWRGIPKNKLVIPLDIHIARISRCLGLTQRKSSDWVTAVEITESLKRFDSEDPLKYDFVLCHHGVTKLCSQLRCRECSLSLNKNLI